MKLKNVLIVVKDIEKSKQFYTDLFGLDVVTDFGENVIMTEGLVLQGQAVWRNFLEKEIKLGGHDAELYFEEDDIDDFIQKLENCNYNIEYINPYMEHDWGQRVIRMYDLDKHVIEIGESMEYVVKRFLKQGFSVEETAKKSQMPIEMVRELAELISKDFKNGFRE